MKKLLLLISIMMVCLSYQETMGQNSEEDVARDILKAFKEKDVALLKKHLTGFMVYAVNDDFFDEEDGKSGNELASLWDGDIREIRYETGDMMGKKVTMASAYFSDSEKDGEINTVVLTTTDGETWKALAYGIATVPKADYEKLPKEIASKETETEKSDHSKFSIEMANGEIVKAPTTEKLKELLGTLNDDNFFLTLNGENGFMQTSTSDKGFIIQYSENESMFEAEAFFTKDMMVKIFEAYIDGGDWKSQATWVGM